jgi:signal transduction histidine kinase
MATTDVHRESSDQDDEARTRRGPSLSGRLRERRSQPTGGGRRPAPSPELAQLNRLLTQLDDVLDHGSATLDLRQVLESIVSRLNQTFSPSVTALVELDERTDTWVAKLARGCVLAPAMAPADLPVPLRDVASRRRPLLVADLTHDATDGVAPGSGAGLYLPLLVDDRLVGLLAIEHAMAGRYGTLDLRVGEELAADVAVMLDNARRYGRLRSLSTDAAEARVTRELHDRLGQWLTFVSFELEGVIRDQAMPSEELTRLYATVQAAIEEMRDTLRQVLAGVGPDRPLARVAEEICARFEERTDIEVDLEITHPTERLAVPVEVEISRILLEALANCERHADATSVDVVWDTDGRVGTLTVRDDGIGFDLSRGVRDSATGLIDMRERADAVGARLDVRSEPGIGTTVVVSTIPTTKEK